MNYNLESTSRRPSRGLHIGYVLLASFLFLLGGGAFWFFSLRSLTSEKAAIAREMERLTNQSMRAELERSKAVEDAKLAMARNRQDEVLALARNATNAIELLRASAEKLKAAAAALKTSEEGRRVAFHPDLVSQARRLYEKDIPALPTSDQINFKLEGARRIEQQLRSNLGTAYEPDAGLSVAAQGAALWAEQLQQTVAGAQSLIAALIRESEIKVTTAKLTLESPTLETVISQLAQAETASRQRLVVETTAAAKTVAADTVAAAEAKGILDEAKRQAEKILAEANEAAARQKRELELRQAQQSIETAKAEVVKQSANDETLKIRLRQKASDPKIQTKLAPFTTPGYVRLPGSLAPDKKPHSLTELKVCGCLEPTMTGLQRLVDVAYSRMDKARPRWTFKRSGVRAWQTNPEEMEMVKEVQGLLNELGPVLVEMELLSP